MSSANTHARLTSVERAPVRLASASVTGIVVAAAIVRARAVLAQQRAYPAADAGRWEFPGGRVEPGETEPEALRRECREELGLDVRVDHRVGTEVTPRAGLVLRLWVATPCRADADPTAVDHAALRWVRADQLDELDWLPADHDLLPAVAALLIRR